MQVKDYLQSLTDDNKIRMEKIGSGNWYWSFPSEEKIAKEAILEKAQEEHDKVAAIVDELQAKIDEAGAARGEDEEMLMDTGKAPAQSSWSSTEKRQVAIARRWSKIMPT